MVLVVRLHPMQPSWHRYFDQAPLERGHLNIRRLVVDGKLVELETVEGLRLWIVPQSGVIELMMRSTVASQDDPAVAAAREALAKSRGPVQVPATLSLEEAITAQENDEAKTRRLAQRRASDEDVLAWLQGQVGAWLTLPEIYAGVYAIGLEMAAAETFSGYLPLFAPDFNHLSTLKERRRAFNALDENQQKELRRQYGRIEPTEGRKAFSSQHRNDAQENREQLRGILEELRRHVLVSANDHGIRLALYKHKNRGDEGCPEAAVDHWESLKLIPAGANDIYHVVRA